MNELHCLVRDNDGLTRLARTKTNKPHGLGRGVIGKRGLEPPHLECKAQDGPKISVEGTCTSKPPGLQSLGPKKLHRTPPASVRLIGTFTLGPKHPQMAQNRPAWHPTLSLVRWTALCCFRSGSSGPSGTPSGPFWDLVRAPVHCRPQLGGSRNLCHGVPCRKERE